MKAASCKAKGRRLQQLVCQRLYEVLGPKYGLYKDDFLSRSMGAQGTDVILSPAAKKVVGNLAIECKNVEALNVSGVFKEHSRKYEPSGATPVLVHTKNHHQVLATITLDYFLNLLEGGQYVR